MDDLWTISFSTRFQGASGRMSVGDLQEIYEQVVSKYQIALGDLPDAAVMRTKLRWAVEIPPIKNHKLFEDIEHFLAVDTVTLMGIAQRKGPLRLQAIFGQQLRKVVSEHIPPLQIKKYTRVFNRLRDKEFETISLIEVKNAIVEDGCGDVDILDEKAFSMLWDFVDDDRQGHLAMNDFILFMHLVDHWCRGKLLP